MWWQRSSIKNACTLLPFSADRPYWLFDDRCSILGQFFRINVGGGVDLMWRSAYHWWFHWHRHSKSHPQVQQSVGIFYFSISKRSLHLCMQREVHVNGPKSDFWLVSILSEPLLSVWYLLRASCLNLNYHQNVNHSHDWQLCCSPGPSEHVCNGIPGHKTKVNSGTMVWQSPEAEEALKSFIPEIDWIRSFHCGGPSALNATTLSIRSDLFPLLLRISVSTFWDFISFQSCCLVCRGRRRRAGWVWRASGLLKFLLANLKPRSISVLRWLWVMLLPFKGWKFVCLFDEETTNPSRGPPGPFEIHQAS